MTTENTEEATETTNTHEHTLETTESKEDTMEAQNDTTETTQLKFNDHYYVGAFIIEVKASNPNGDPDDENNPRSIDGTGMISAGSVKRKIRDYLALHNGARLLYKSNTFVANNISKSIQSFSGDGSLTDYFLDQFQAVRMFGSVLNVGEIDKRLVKSVRGPVVFSHALSTDTIEIDQHTITRVNKASPRKNKNPTQEQLELEARDSEIGKFSVVRHSLYVGTFTINGRQCSVSRMTEQDVNDMIDALVKGYMESASAARPQVSVKFVFLHDCGTDGFDMDPLDFESRVDAHVVNGKAVVKFDETELEAPKSFADKVVRV